jgi:hypothetical protein
VLEEEEEERKKEKEAHTAAVMTPEQSAEKACAVPTLRSPAATAA